MASDWVAMQGSGENVHQTMLASGGRVNASNCRGLWDGVVAGVPSDASDVEDGPNGYPVRNSVMESFTQHNPRPCLSADDVEGLVTLYPDCSPQAITRVVCTKVSLKIGIMRLAIFVGLPLLVGLLFTIVLSSAVHAYYAEEAEERRARIKMLRKENREIKERLTVAERRLTLAARGNAAFAADAADDDALAARLPKPTLRAAVAAKLPVRCGSQRRARHRAQTDPQARPLRSSPGALSAPSAEAMFGGEEAAVAATATFGSDSQLGPGRIIDGGEGFDEGEEAALDADEDEFTRAERENRKTDMLMLSSGGVSHNGRFGGTAGASASASGGGAWRGFASADDAAQQQQQLPVAASLPTPQPATLSIGQFAGAFGQPDVTC